MAGISHSTVVLWTIILNQSGIVFIESVTIKLHPLFTVVMMDIHVLSIMCDVIAICMLYRVCTSKYEQ